MTTEFMSSNATHSIAEVKEKTGTLCTVTYQHLMQLLPAISKSMPSNAGERILLTLQKLLDPLRGVLKKKENLRDGSIAIEFERIGKGKPTYSIHPPSKFEIRADHVSWMSKSKQPFNLVGNAGYH